jgi:hypothetical protein
MEKVIRDGKVAVLYSSGYGAGWYTWNSSHEQLIYSPKIVEMVEARRAREIDEDWVEENLGIKNVYCGGASALKIEWVPQGMMFYIDEYDGSEQVRMAETDFMIA